MTPAPSRLRIAFSGALFVLLLVVVSLRSVQLTVVEGDWLKQRAGRQQYQRVRMQARRGPIVDRNGEPLVLTVDAPSVAVRTREFQDRPGAMQTLAHVLDLDEAFVRRKTHSKTPYTYLKRRVTPTEEAAIEQLQLPGVVMELGVRRIYPHGDLGSQLLGFTGDEGGGLEGLEKQLEDVLRGEEGEVVVERDAHGRRLLTEGSWRPSPQPGARVELTIDAGLQHVAEIELEKGVLDAKAQAGLAVALDPATGEILALAQYPRFNPNNREAARPESWRNRAVADSFEPGSTMKAFIAAAALDRGAVRPDERIFCENGRYAVGRRAVRDHEPYGWLTFAEVIQYSSNICTAKIGERLGREQVWDALTGFGFGRLSGVDLPGEFGGLMRPVNQWGRIHLVTTSFGQGIAVTPLQLVRGYAAFANGGKLMRPYVVKRVVDADGQVLLTGAPKVEGQPISAQTAATVTALLERVVEAGTATRAQIAGIRVAGKTGTAQKVDPRGGYSARDRISSFVGYAPAEDPRIVIAVVIDTPRAATYGGLVAAPVFRRLAQHTLESFGINPAPEPAQPTTPSRLPGLQSVALSGDQTGGVPNVVGFGMRDAVARLDRAGFGAEIDGWGVVLAQNPPPGVEAQPGDVVHLHFDAGIR